MDVTVSDESDWLGEIKTETMDNTYIEEEVHPIEDIVFPIDIINIKTEPDDIKRTASTSIGGEASSGVKVERDLLINTVLDDHHHFGTEHDPARNTEVGSLDIKGENMPVILSEDPPECQQDESSSGDAERKLRRVRRERKANTKSNVKYCESDDANAAENSPSSSTPVDTYLPGYRCQYCDKVYTRPNKLTIHLRDHSGERPFKCAECSKSFKVKEIYKRHLRVHSGERPYHCQYCGKSFNGPDDVRKHERVHTGEKPFPCKYCGRAFRDLGSVRRHEMSHMGVKNFKCEECGKLFSRGCGLRRHQRKHTGERPYQCHICLKTYPRAYTLTCHLKLHEAKQ